MLDLGSREIVGYALSHTPDAKLVKQALINVIKHHAPDTKQLLFHSDQGVQYTSHLFRKTLIAWYYTKQESAGKLLGVAVP